MLVLLLEGLMKCTIEMALCGIPRFIKMGAGVQAIMFCLRILRGCNVGNTDGRDL
jgi:hypothetical protein